MCWSEPNKAEGKEYKSLFTYDCEECLPELYFCLQIWIYVLTVFVNCLMYLE